MCSSYWTVSDTLTCPACGEPGEWEIQTHEFGQVGSCINFYALGDRPSELTGINTVIAEDGWCPRCGQQCSAAITIRDGELVEVKLVAL